MCGIFDSFVFGIEPMRPQRYNYFLNYARKTQKKLKIMTSAGGATV